MNRVNRENGQQSWLRGDLVALNIESAWLLGLLLVMGQEYCLALQKLPWGWGQWKEAAALLYGYFGYYQPWEHAKVSLWDQGVGSIRGTCWAQTVLQLLKCSFPYPFSYPILSSSSSMSGWLLDSFSLISQILRSTENIFQGSWPFTLQFLKGTFEKINAWNHSREHTVGHNVSTYR